MSQADPPRADTAGTTSARAAHVGASATSEPLEEHDDAEQRNDREHYPADHALPAGREGRAAPALTGKTDRKGLHAAGREDAAVPTDGPAATRTRAYRERSAVDAARLATIVRQELARHCAVSLPEAAPSGSQLAQERLDPKHRAEVARAVSEVHRTEQMCVLELEPLGVALE